LDFQSHIFHVLTGKPHPRNGFKRGPNVHLLSAVNQALLDRRDTLLLFDLLLNLRDLYDRAMLGPMKFYRRRGQKFDGRRDEGRVPRDQEVMRAL
jgi:hypothetical protein